MNPMIRGALAMFLRQAVIFIAGWLGMSGALDPYMNDLAQWSSTAVVVVFTVGSALYAKFKERQKLVTALAAPHPITEHEAEAMVKNPSVMTPSVTASKDEVPV